jgi:HPt (histidine-containing phosphotransfer) domain-containing protein
VQRSVIDLPTFAELRLSVGDEFAAELVDTFLEEAPAMLAELRAAMGAGDADGYRRAAHSLKANGNTFGALEFASLAGAIEQRGLTGDSAADTSMVHALDSAYVSVAAELTDLGHPT